MQSIRKIICITSCITFFTYSKSFSQQKDIYAYESSCVELYSKLTTFAEQDYDSLELYSDSFETKFTNFIKNNPATLGYAFNKLIDSKSCFIETSSDGNFRIYSWDTWTGGTMHFFNEIYQWKADGRVFTKVPQYEDGDPGNFCSKIFTIDIDNKPYYLAIKNGIFSTKDAMQSIYAFTINKNQLIDTVKLFKTKTKTLNSIDVGFDFFSVADHPERPLELIKYDDKKKIVYIPVVNENGEVIKRNILYQLKGNKLEFIGIETGVRE